MEFYGIGCDAVVSLNFVSNFFAVHRLQLMILCKN